MMFGEYTSVTEIHSLIPGLVPAPHCWGKYTSGSPDTYFFLSDFVDMDTSAPDPARFTARLAELHRKSKSPNGMFGFEVTISAHPVRPKLQNEAARCGYQRFSIGWPKTSALGPPPCCSAANGRNRERRPIAETPSV